MHVTLVDPSNFTLPYDYALASALLEHGCQVSILKRMDRANEQGAPDGVLDIEHFYGLTEGHRDFLKRIRLFTPAKLVEHVIDLSLMNKLLRELKTDLVHYQWLVVPWLDKRLLAPVIRRLPTVLTVHDTRLYHGSSTGLVQARGWMDAIRSIDNVIVHTKSSYEKLRTAGVPEKALTIIPHGTLAIDGCPIKSKIHASTQIAGEKVLTLLLFGYLKNYKGLDTVANAIELLDAESLRLIRIVIAGKPNDEVLPTLQRLKALLPPASIELDLRFLPEADLAQHIEEADVVLFPYHRIDASGAFMATLPFGKIVIASRVGVFTEYLVHRKNGMLFSGGSASELAAYIDAVANDANLRRTLKNGALDLAVKIPGWGEIARQTMCVYERASRDE